MKVIVCGSPSWSNVNLIAKILSALPSTTKVISPIMKCPRGATLINDLIVKELGLQLLKREASLLIDEHTKQSPITVCYVFHDEFENCNETKKLTGELARSGVPIRLVTNAEDRESSRS